MTAPDPERPDALAAQQPVDYRGLFAAGPTPYLVLTPELMVCEVNQAYLEATGRERADLLGRHVFDAFRNNPNDPDADGVRNLNASLQRALATGAPDVMALQQYDIPVGDGAFEERWWSPINTPVLDDAGTVVFLIHRVEDATAYVRARGLNEHRSVAGRAATAADLEVDLIAAARKLQELNEQLRQANAREHEVAIRLQRAMLPGAASSATRYPVAARYLPADALQVCGDWYDVVELTDTRLSVSVGDIVGHGLPAAAVMGQLRSALIAATLGVAGPGKALEVLDLFARTIDGAVASTVVQAVLDTAAQTITYSSAGHVPPMLVRPGGEVELLDQANGVPLAARLESRERPQATTACPAGSTLILYTDGLIERRRENIGVGLSRLADTLARHAGLEPEPLADAILADLGIGADAFDDTALIVVQV